MHRQLSDEHNHQDVLIVKASRNSTYKVTLKTTMFLGQLGFHRYSVYICVLIYDTQEQLSEVNCEYDIFYKTNNVKEFSLTNPILYIYVLLFY